MEQIEKGEIQQLNEVERQLRAKLKIVQDQMNEIQLSPEKPQKKKNYALKKVENPPSDNE